MEPCTGVQECLGFAEGRGERQSRPAVWATARNMFEAGEFPSSPSGQPSRISDPTTPVELLRWTDISLDSLEEGNSVNISKTALSTRAKVIAMQSRHQNESSRP